MYLHSPSSNHITITLKAIITMDTAILKGQGHVIFPHHLNIKELLISASLVDIYKHTNLMQS